MVLIGMQQIVAKVFLLTLFNLEVWTNSLEPKTYLLNMLSSEG